MTKFIAFIPQAACAAVIVLFIAFTPATLPAADNLAEMFREGSAKGELMLYSFSQDYDEEGDTERLSDKNDNAFGTIFYYRTAELKGISFGVSYGSANNFYSDDDKYPDRGLKANHDGFSRFVEGYAQANLLNTTVKYGIQMLHTPLANPDPGRVLPKTFKGLTLVNRSIKGLELHGYYITEFADWADDRFENIARKINPDSDKEALIVGGIKYGFQSDAANVFVEGFGYNLNNFFNAGYISVDIGKKFNDAAVFIKPSYVKQKSTGDAYMGEIDTFETGFEAGIDYKGAEFRGFFAATGDDAYETPWGFGRIIKTEEIISGLVPEQKAYATSVGYDFGRLGIDGLYAKIFYGYFDNAGNESNAHEMEYQVIYDFGKKFKPLEGLNLDVMYTNVYSKDASDITRLHIRLKYAFALLN